MNRVADFIDQHDGTTVDVTGAYGNQSPDLVTAYVRHLSGNNIWSWPEKCVAAADLWRHGLARMGEAGFRRVRYGRPGDVVVFSKSGKMPYGTVGVLQSRFPHEMLGQVMLVFTQNPGPALSRQFVGDVVLGYYRHESMG